MIQIDELTLIAGADIPVPKLGENIHQPKIKDIAIIGEKKFFKYLGYFNIDKKSMERNYQEKFKKDLKDLNPTEEQINDLVNSILGDSTDFDILMQFINPADIDKLPVEERKVMNEIREGIEVILMLTLPGYTFSFEDRFIFCTNKEKEKTILIDDDKLKVLKEVYNIIFCLNMNLQEDFNPSNDKAKTIADKIRKGREKVRLIKGDKLEDQYIIANYISSISIGTNALNILDAINLTVYELFNQIKRFGRKTQHDYSVQSAMAGAQGVEIVDWLEDQNKQNIS